MIVKTFGIGTTLALAACAFTPRSADMSMDASGNTDGMGPPQFISCIGLAPTCGPAGDEDCCSTATAIPSGSFFRSFDEASDNMFSDKSYPAAVSAFRLDRFEVTVGRFRKFVEAGMGTQMHPPATGSGAHAKIPDSGWNASWNASLAIDTATLTANLIPWSDSPGPEDNRPIGDITWFEAFAFCAWDEGFMPTETEWNYAASGGSDQRAYPWSSPAKVTAINCAEANYGGSSYPSTACVPAGTNDVGGTSPNGDAPWGQADMGGNILEWVLDWFASYRVPCSDCANLVPGTARVLRGGDLADVATSLRNGYRRGDVAPSMRFGGVGVRCARTL